MSSIFWKPAPVSFLRDENDRNASDVASVPLYPPSHGGLHQRMLLPIYKHKRQILYAMEHYCVVVIVGETGSGKSTQIPQYLVEGGWTGHDFTIVCTQPRRMAATSLATRVAHEMGCRVGDKVGYTVRFDDQTSPQTQVKVSRVANMSDTMARWLSCLTLHHHFLSVRDRWYSSTRSHHA